MGSKAATATLELVNATPYKFGHTGGFIIGYLLPDILLTVVTSGGWAAKWLAKPIQYLLELVGKIGQRVAKAIEGIAKGLKYIDDLIEFVAGLAKGGADNGLVKAFTEFFEGLRAWLMAAAKATEQSSVLLRLKQLGNVTDAKKLEALMKLDKVLPDELLKIFQHKKAVGMDQAAIELLIQSGKVKNTTQLLKVLEIRYLSDGKVANLAQVERLLQLEKVADLAQVERLLKLDRIYDAHYLEEMLAFEKVQDGAHLERMLKTLEADNLLKAGAVKNLNMRRVDYGADDLSLLAKEYRIRNKYFEDGNVAAIEYVDLSGKPKTMVKESIQGGQHSELVLFEELDRLGIPRKNVKRLYSELEPCELGQAKCKDLISKSAPDANITYTWDYPSARPELSPVRNFGVHQRRNMIDSLK